MDRKKYRPTSINELLLDDCTMNKVKTINKEKSLPNIIITKFLELVKQQQFYV